MKHIPETEFVSVTKYASILWNHLSNLLGG